MRRFNSKIPSALVRVVLAALLILSLVASPPVIPSTAASTLTIELWIGQSTIQVNGSPQIIDAVPFIMEGRTMVPIRFVSEALGAKVDWLATERKVEVTLGGRVIDLWIDKKTALIDGVQASMDVPPIIDDFRAFVPLRFISEALGAKVDWDPTTQKIAISLEQAALVGSAWPLSRHDVQRSGRSPFNGPPRAVFRWQFSTEGAIDASPVIAPDGTVILASSDGVLYAVASDGTKKWAFDASAPLHDTPAVGNDGTIYLPASSGVLFALTPQGDLKWRLETKAGGSSPLILSDGIICLGTTDGTLLAVSEEGSVKWQHPLPTGPVGTPALAPDGSLLVAAGRQLFALDPSSGQERWSFRAESLITAGPALNANGDIYLGCADGHLVALRPSGQLAWEFGTGGAIRSSPAIGGDGMIYFGADDFLFYALTADGLQRWQFQAGGEIHSSPALSTDGTIYFGCDDRRLYALGTDGTKRFEFKVGLGIRSSPAIGEQEVLYVGCEDGKLYAIGPS